VQDEVLSLEWLASGPSNAFIHDFTVIRRDLTRQIHACVPEILDEIRFAFDKHFCNGRDTGDGWKEVVVNDAVRRAVCSHWFARLSERGVLPRCLEMVDVLWTDRPDLPIVHSKAHS
jgi:hypothetical protein